MDLPGTDRARERAMQQPEWGVETLDELAADGAAVRRLLELTRRPRRVLTIPAAAVDAVAGLDSYGD